MLSAQCLCWTVAGPPFWFFNVPIHVCMQRASTLLAFVAVDWLSFPQESSLCQLCPTVLCTGNTLKGLVTKRKAGEATVPFLSYRWWHDSSLHEKNTTNKSWIKKKLIPILMAKTINDLNKFSLENQKSVLLLFLYLQLYRQISLGIKCDSKCVCQLRNTSYKLWLLRYNVKGKKWTYTVNCKKYWWMI